MYGHICTARTAMQQVIWSQDPWAVVSAPNLASPPRIAADRVGPQRILRRAWLHRDCQIGAVHPCSAPNSQVARQLPRSPSPSGFRPASGTLLLPTPAVRISAPAKLTVSPIPMETRSVSEGSNRPSLYHRKPEAAQENVARKVAKTQRTKVDSARLSWREPFGMMP